MVGRPTVGPPLIFQTVQNLGVVKKMNVVIYSIGVIKMGPEAHIAAWPPFGNVQDG